MNPNNPNAGSGMKALLKHMDLVASLAVVLVVTMLVIPLPSPLIDVFITLNISCALAIVVSTMYLRKALDFSSFPSLLLLTTMFRLAINVSVTRLILTRGDAGSVVRAFGQFVVGGNVVIGLVIFLILVIIQFIVVTNGAGRVAEVGARFTLDAMPGKQMAIDADLNAGLITDEQARNRRAEIGKEADFYGAMDGAAKFVRGDAIAAVVIVLICLIGGIIVGVAEHHLSFSVAAHTYSLLTVGDGLAAQIPALLISVATGIIVTRSASKKDLGTDIATQILSQRKAPMVAGGVICMFALVPGLPTIPFLVVGGCFLAVGYAVRDGLPEAIEAKRAEAAKALPAPPVASKDAVMGELPLDPLELSIGFGLVPLVDRRNGGGSLVNRVSAIRRQIAGELGIVIPSVRIHDEIGLDSHEYVFKVRGVEVARGSLIAGHHLAMDPGDAVGSLTGIATTEPAFGLPAVWISDSTRSEAEARG
ncbi:MAG: flagellar biosynthesis protein FlhA, partial [Solirubrobacteraceae bacterium]